MVWSRENAERWIALGARDGQRLKEELAHW